MTQPLNLDQIEGAARNAARIGSGIHPDTALTLAAEIRRLRARVTELETRHLPKLCECGHTRLVHTVPAPHSCFAGKLRDAAPCDCTEYRQLSAAEAERRITARHTAQTEQRTAAEEMHVVADDTIWLERRPCGCIVAAVVANVPGEWNLTTPEDVALHFHHTEGERRRAAQAGLTVEPVTSGQYREQYRERWHCDKHAAASAARRP